MICKADIHIHSTLSPCGSLESSPSRIVNEALKKGLDIIAVSDHNSTLNLPALKKSADGRIAVLFGIEVQTISETHLLVIFETLDTAMAFGELIYQKLPEIDNNPDYFGDQIVVDEAENIIGVEKRLLLQSALMDVEEVETLAHTLGGLVFPSHIDRESFSIISQLGFIPENLRIDGIEISGNITRKDAETRFPEYCRKYPLITNSDSHYPEDIGKAFTLFDIKEPSFTEISKALKRENGRKCYLDA